MKRLCRSAVLAGALAMSMWLRAALPAAAAPAAPELIVQYGNSSLVTALAVDPSGRFLASSSDDGLFVWDLPSGHMLRRMAGRGTRIAGFSADGRYVFDGLHLFDFASGRVVRSIDAPAICLGSFARSADGRWLSAVVQNPDHSRQATIWDLRAPSSAPRRFTLHPADRLSDDNTDACPTAFSADGRRFYSDFPVVERDTESGRLVRTIGTGYDLVLGFSPDGRFMVTGNKSSRTARLPLDLRSVADGHVVRSWGREAETTEASFSRDGRFFAICSFGTMSVMDTATGKERTYDYSGVRLATVALNGGGDQLIIGTQRGDLRVADLVRGVQRQFWNPRAVSTLALSPNRQWLVTVHEDRSDALGQANGRRSMVDLHEDYTMVWDLTSGQPAGTVAKACEAVAFTPDSRRFGCWSKNDVEVYDTASLSLVRSVSLAGARAAPEAPTFYPLQPGKRIFFLAGATRLGIAQDGTGNDGVPAIAVIDLTSGTVDGPLISHAARARVAASAGGRALEWIGDDDTVREYDPLSRTTRPVARIPAEATAVESRRKGFPPSFIGIAPGGRYALGASGTHTVVYDLTTAATPAGSIDLGSAASDPVFLGFSADGTLAAFDEWAGADDANSTVTLVALPSGHVVQRFRGNTGAVGDFTLSQDKRLLITTDGAVRLWDARGARQTGTLFAGGTDAGAWLVTAPDGAFDGSPRAWDAMLWRFHGRTLDAAAPETFFNDFYDPGLLADLVAGRKPLKRTIASLDRRFPQIASVAIASRAPYGRRVRVDVAVRDGGAGARDVRLMRNGSLVRLWPGDALHGAKAATLHTDVRLVAGDNVLAAYAFNRDGVRSPIASTIATSKAAARRGVAYVLGIGLDAYANADFRLHYAHADAAAFDAELRAQGKKLGRYAAVRSSVMFDAKATKRGILASIANLRRQAQPEDVIFIFFAGHGFAGNGRFYLVPYDLGYRGRRMDVTQAGIELLEKHGISDAELAAALRSVDARNIVLVIDACQSGQALGDDKRIGPLNAKGLAQLAYDKGMYVLAAAQSYQSALESPHLGHGLLTFSLVVDALHRRSAAPSTGGMLYVLPWFSYAQREVPALQRTLILQGSPKGVGVGFAQGESRATLPLDRRLQRPRVYYPRSLDSHDLPIARFP